MLPIEILQKILNYLNIRTVIDLALINKSLWDASYRMRWTNVIYMIRSEDDVDQLKDYIESGLLSRTIKTLRIVKIDWYSVSTLLKCNLDVINLIIDCESWSVMFRIAHKYLVISDVYLLLDDNFMTALMTIQSTWKVSHSIEFTSDDYVADRISTFVENLSSDIYMISTLFHPILIPCDHMVDQVIKLPIIDIYRGNQPISGVHEAIEAHLGVTPIQSIYLLTIDPIMCWQRDTHDAPHMARHIYLPHNKLEQTYPRAHSILVHHITYLKEISHSSLVNVQDIYLLNHSVKYSITDVTYRFKSIQNIYHIKNNDLNRVYSRV